MEDNEIKEKLLCVLRNNILDFKKKDGSQNWLYHLKTNSGDITLNLWWNIYKIIDDTRSEIVKPKYFWQKEKTITTVTRHSVFDYRTARVHHQNYSYVLTKDEYEEIRKLMAEKTEERTLLELDKLCNNK